MHIVSDDSIKCFDKLANLLLMHYLEMLQKIKLSLLWTISKFNDGLLCAINPQLGDIYRCAICAKQRIFTRFS